MTSNCKTYTRQDMARLWAVSQSTADRWIKRAETLCGHGLGDTCSQDGRARVFDENAYQILVKYYPLPPRGVQINVEPEGKGADSEVDADLFDAEIEPVSVTVRREQSRSLVPYRAADTQNLSYAITDFSERRQQIIAAKQDTEQATGVVAFLADRLAQTVARELIIHTEELIALNKQRITVQAMEELGGG